jgi:NADPH:quinone reductase-like Zn-dependent oxidoreductase
MAKTTGMAHANDIEIVQQKYGMPGEVLRVAPLAALEPGPKEVLIKVTKRPIHPGDVHMLMGAPNGGRPSAINAKRGRVPGLEGAGVIERLGSEVDGAGGLRAGQRVAFFHPGARAWATKVVVPATALVVLPDTVPDAVAAQMLVNTVAARTVLRAGHTSLPRDVRTPVHVLQSAAGSAVGLLITKLAIEAGVRPIRLVRSKDSAAALRARLPGAPVISTDASDWMDKFRSELADHPLQVAIDSVGGSLLDDIASLLESGGTVINFGWLGAGEPDLSAFAPRQLTLMGVSIGAWFSEPADVRAKDFEVALRLAVNEPTLFEVAAEYPLEDFLSAIDHSSRRGKSGTVLLTG